MLRSSARRTASELGRADADEDRDARDRRLLHELEAQPARDAQHVVVQRHEPVAQRAADHLVHRVVATDVLAHEQQLPVRGEQPGGVQPARALEGRLAQAVGQRGEQRAVDRRPVGQARRVHRDLLERALSADPAGGGRVERARARVVQQRPGDLDDVGLELGGRPGRAGGVDQPLAVQEPERELLVVARRAHRDRERGAVDADLERLLDRDLVLDPRAAHGRVRAADPDVGHVGTATPGSRACARAGRRAPAARGRS